MTPEQIRLQQSRDPKTPWKKWGSYLSERQWSPAGKVFEVFQKSL